VKGLERVIFALSLGGLLFSGYLSSVKFFNNTCAFNESCPYVFGYPACYYGFGLFLILFLLSLNISKYLKVVNKVSLVGILFAGYLTATELPSIFQGTKDYFFGLPTCALGFFFYLLIFILSYKLLKLKNR